METFKIYYKTKRGETQYVQVYEKNLNSAIKTGKLFCKGKGLELLGAINNQIYK